MSEYFPIQANEIRGWLIDGIKKGATHCLIIYDSWDYENYPRYVMPGEDVYEITKEYEKEYLTVERLMEIYNLSMDIDKQLKEDRAMHY
jgi:hypothetical protein